VLELENDSIQMRDINAVGKKYDYADFKKQLKKEIKALDKEKLSDQRCQYIWNYMNFNLDYQFESECSASSSLKARNDRWISILEPIIAEKNAFVVVGIMHLYGKCGLINQFREMGYSVEPVEIKK